MRSIVVPVYNEEERIEHAINALLPFEDAEIIISDDGSTDDTVEIAQGYSKKQNKIVVLSDEHKGKGAALKKGFNFSKGSVLGFLDTDLSADPAQLEKLFAVVEKGEADLAVGSRELQESALLIKQPLYRRTLGRIYSLLARFLFRVDVSDFQCGCKAFTRELWESADVKSDGFVFDTELIVRAHVMGYRVKEVPITWRNDVRTRVSSLKDPVGMFIGLLKIKWRLCYDQRK